MDKNKGLYIVLGFLLLCIFLSLDKKEGFATINVSQFETACNSDGNTCMINTSGSRGVNCSVPTDDIPYYNISGDDAHSESFNIQVDGCSSISYQTGAQTPIARPCANSGEPYVLSGCSPKCVAPGSKLGYVLNIPPELQYINPGVMDITPRMLNNGNSIASCQSGYIPAKNIISSFSLEK